MESMEIKKIQNKLLEMLVFFHCFCDSHQLTYYVVGGTMLGAVRHTGFIPWDDDVDVAMPRQDYERLRNFTELYEGKYLFETVYSPSKSFCYPYSKLYDVTTTLIENTQQKTRRGLFLDIFPLDGIGQTEEEAFRNFNAIQRKKNLLALHTTAYRKDRQLYKNAVILAASALPNFLVDPKKLCLKINEMSKKYRFQDAAWGGNLVGAWGRKEVMPTRIFGNPTLYRFENTEVYGVEDYNAFLTRFYGDWRALPPPEERMTHHSYEYDLNRSWLEDI